MVDLAEKYNHAAKTYYEERYVDGGWENNIYMQDEKDAHNFWMENREDGKLISLGVGSGQDIPILAWPGPENFTGYDLSQGMLNNAKEKFPDHNFVLADCNENIDDSCDVLVSLFGVPNYIGLPKLMEHYKNFNAQHAFFIFYAEWYDDGIAEEYHKYTKEELQKSLYSYNPIIKQLNENYYIVKW